MAPVAAILAQPVRLTPSGRFATVEDGTDAAHGQQVAALIGTRRGERPLAPTFGITDPAFAEVDAAEVAAQVSVFGPPVDIVNVSTTYDNTGTVADVVVEFD